VFSFVELIAYRFCNLHKQRLEAISGCRPLVTASSRILVRTAPARPGEPGCPDTPAAEEESSVSAIEALAPSEPAAACDGQDTAVPSPPPGGPPPTGQCCGLRVLNGRPDQVRAARQFVREHLACHPAAGDAALVASELAANSVTHSASGLGGRFLIRVTALDGRHALVGVTDQGGPFAPQNAAPDGESGRGLVVVRRLACMFLITDHDGFRTFTAIVPAADPTPPDSSGAPGQPLTATTPATTSSGPERVHDDAT
jgi:anti-sigma regulatory factor (Ser/Thr protein kinase)